MSVLAFILDRYQIDPDVVRFWDVTAGRLNQSLPLNATTILAEHLTPPGYIGVLTHWQIYYRPIAPAFPIEGDLHFLNDTVGCFWRLAKNGSAIPGLHEIRQLSNPWGSNVSPTEGAAFYMSEVGAADTLWQLLFRIGAALPAVNFEVAARLIGFDFPRHFLDQSQTPPPRP